MRHLRHARLLLQLVLLALAAFIVWHGMAGPQIAPRNLATVLTWVHYRGLLIVALLALGNVFCMGCPMILVRDAGRRLAHPALRWPHWLRTKWLSIALLAGVLYAYELFDLWGLPRGTAWLVIVYFAAALVIDVLFAGASFCKYVCPVGQFNFVAATMSPTELRVRSLATCRSCATVDCIKGTRDPVLPTKVIQRGCELALFQPLKVGNLDCTLCLDCVAACPHDNVAFAPRLPGEELLDLRRRSGIGRLTRRLDIVALMVVFVFAALLNAAAMTQPAGGVERRLASLLHVESEWPVLLVIFIIGLLVLPAILLGTAATVTNLVAQPSPSLRSPDDSIVGTAARYACTLVPFGAGMWLAHYGFHLLTGALTVIPVTQSAAIDAFGWAAFGNPLWRLAGMRPGAVFPLQLGVVLLGAAGSLALAHRVSLRDSPSRAAAATTPWAAVVMTLTALAIWILAQPMDLRGLGVAG